MGSNLYTVQNIPTTTGRGMIDKVVVFNSIGDFVKCISNAEENKYFKGQWCSSKARLDSWSGGLSLEQAIDTLQHGWNEGAAKMERQLKEIKADDRLIKEYKNVLDVCGYQAIVPLYMNGVPNCMLQKKMQRKKQKIITINRSVSVSSKVSSDMLMAESMKVLQIIYKLEKSGYRINLNLVISTGIYAVKIRLKSANERLSVSKLAFPLVHTAMFRKLFFRFIETSEFTTRFHTDGYGTVPHQEEMDQICSSNKEIHLPTILSRYNESEIKTLSVEQLIDKLK